MILQVVVRLVYCVGMFSVVCCGLLIVLLWVACCVASGVWICAAILGLVVGVVLWVICCYLLDILSCAVDC